MIQVSERVAKERPPSSRDVNEGLLCPPDDRAGAGEVVAGTTPDRIDSQVAGIISDELRAEPVERRPHDAPAPLDLRREQLHVTVCRIEVEAAAVAAAVRQGGVLAVTIPMGDPDAEFLLKPRLLIRWERLGGGDYASDRKAAEQVLAQQVDKRIQGTRIYVKKKWRKCANPPPQSAEFLLYRRTRRDNPHVLKTVEAKHSAVDVAGVADPEVVRCVSHMGPDVKEVGAFLLAARERVSGETKGLT